VTSALPKAEPRFAKLIAYARAMAPVLDRHTYYEILDVPQTADLAAIRAAFYRLATDLHPDRYHTLPDAAVREQLSTIYARMSEGYRVLTNPQRRAAYDKSLTEGKTRYVSTDRERKGPQNPEDALQHPEAKKFFRLGMIALGGKDWKGAVLNFKFARNFEPDAQVIGEKLSEAETGLKALGK